MDPLAGHQGLGAQQIRSLELEHGNEAMGSQQSGRLQSLRQDGQAFIEVGLGDGQRK